jgi:aspartate/methionine/tyrosine aminotransferase
MTSWELAKYLVKEHRVAVVPGSIFGNNGEGYVRISFAVNREILKEGIDRTRAGLEKL